MDARYLYVLKDSDMPHVKIGITTDIHRRIAEIPEQIDEGSSLCIRCYRGAHVIEKLMHVMLGNVKADGHFGNGKSEWFLDEARRLVVDFTCKNRATLPIGDWVGVNAIPEESAASHMLQIPVTAAFFKAFRNYCTDADTTIPQFSPAILGAAVGLHHVTGKPLPKAKEPKS